MENLITTEANTTDSVTTNDQFSDLKFNKDSFLQLIAIVREQQDRITALESKNQTSSTKREMTIEDATRVTAGDLRDKTHNECVVILGLSYGQVYSARTGQTFKAVHADMLAQGMADLWIAKKRA